MVAITKRCILRSVNGKGAAQMKHRIKKIIHRLHVAANRGFSWVDCLRDYT